MMGVLIVPNLAVAKNSLEESLKKLKKSGTRVSAHVVNLQTGKELASVDESLPLNPASSIKLFTAYVALKRLGLNYQFKTEAYQNSDHRFCIKGGGDPSFVMEHLYLMMEALKRKGISNIKMPLTVDSSVFDSELIPEDRTDQDSERAYNSPISGINFNYNTITVYVNPAVAGEPAKVALDWPFPFVKIKSKVMTGKSTDITWDKDTTTKTGKVIEETVSLGGKIAVGGDEWRKPFRITQPVQAFGLAFLKMAQDQGLMQGEVDSSQVKEGACIGQLIYTHQSAALSDVIKLMNKYSNNFIADSLVKILDHEVNRHAGTADGGLQYIRDQLQQMGIESQKQGRKFVSGSGLTRDNLFSASDFTKLLKQIHLEKKFLPEFFSSLPLAGIDGTLKKKYTKTQVAELLRGKTGTLNGVQSLVGVYPNSKGEWIGVSILVNGRSGIPETELAKWLSEL